MFLTVATAVLVLSVGIILYFHRKLTFWQRQGVPAPPALIYQWKYNTRDLTRLDQELLRDLGQVYGVYEGLEPTLVVSDPDLIREVLITEYSKFPNHYPFVLGDPHVDKILSNLKGQDWKRLRSICSPSFTTGKFRSMSSIVSKSMDTLIQNLELLADSDRAVGVIKIFKSFSFDVLLRFGFGVEINTYKTPHLIKNLDDVFANQFPSIFTMLFPILSQTLGIKDKALKPYRYFLEMADKLIQERQNLMSDVPAHKDLLQMMLDAGEKTKQGKATEKTISDTEIKTQSLSFLLAGYQTKAAALACALYQLAMNPKIQEKLYAELSEFDQFCCPDTIRELKYLDAFFKELLRANSPISRIQRQCVKKHVLGTVTVLPGTLVSIPVYALHHDPNLFSNPQEFIPERFLENGTDVNHHEFAYIPFGGGPRTCIARKFSILETKSTIAKLVKHFKFETTSETTKLSFQPATFDHLEPNEIFIRVTKRQI